MYLQNKISPEVLFTPVRVFRFGEYFRTLYSRKELHSQADTPLQKREWFSPGEDIKIFCSEQAEKYRILLHKEKSKPSKTGRIMSNTLKNTWLGLKYKLLKNHQKKVDFGVPTFI